MFTTQGKYGDVLTENEFLVLLDESKRNQAIIKIYSLKKLTVQQKLHKSGHGGLGRLCLLLPRRWKADLSHFIIDNQFKLLRLFNHGFDSKVVSKCFTYWTPTDVTSSSPHTSYDNTLFLKYIFALHECNINIKQQVLDFLFVDYIDKSTMIANFNQSHVKNNNISIDSIANYDESGHEFVYNRLSGAMYGSQYWLQENINKFRTSGNFRITRRAKTFTRPPFVNDKMYQHFFSKTLSNFFVF